MTDMITVSRSEIEALIPQHSYAVEYSNLDSELVISIDDLRALLDKAAISQAEPVLKIALDNTNLKKRINVLEDLLSSACNIANRNGEDTHWLRFAGQLHIHGISPITPKTFKILPSDDYKPPPPADKKDAENWRSLIEGITLSEEVSGTRLMMEHREIDRKRIIKDAERYRWLRDSAGNGILDELKTKITDDTFDEAIDTAMKVDNNFGVNMSIDTPEQVKAKNETARIIADLDLAKSIAAMKGE